MLNRFLDYIDRQHLFPSGRQVLLAVSGGRDSVVMAHLVHSAGISFAIAHCNFNLRPGDCDRDQQFVASLADAYGVPFHTVSFDTRDYAAAHGFSVEEAARRLRYSFFSDLCLSHGYPCVATAHHRDDSIETFFLNLFRGTGIAGLHGIRPSSTLSLGRSDTQPLSVVRPLLCFSRAEIDAYVAENHLRYVEDITNTELDARRNRIRLRLMPLLRELYPSVDKTMAANIERLHDTELLYRAYVDELSARFVKPWPALLPNLSFQILSIDLGQLSSFRLPLSTLLFELLHPHGFNAAQVDDILATNTSGSLFYSPTHIAERHEGHLLVAPRTTPVVPVIEMKDVSADVPFGDGVHAVTVDADTLSLPLTLRPWRQADRFHPFGMKHSRLVSDFLKDLKISCIERQHLHLLVTADDRIVWVVGLRADDRFRVTPSTTNRLSISLQSI